MQDYDVPLLIDLRTERIPERPRQRGNEVPPLQKFGLQLRSRDAYHRYFRSYPGHPRDIHVHVCEAGSHWEAEHLRFRDYLRTHPEARDRYADAKRTAAAMLVGRTDRRRSSDDAIPARP